MKTGPQMPRISNPAASWARDILEPDQLARSKVPYGRRRLGRGTLFLLWALRIYVALMVLIIGLAVWNAFH